MLKYSVWGENIRAWVEGDRYNMSWADFDTSGNLIAECKRGDFLFPGLTDEEMKEAETSIKKMTLAPFKDAYLRFGNIPPCGRSKNHATGETEAGVSCYPLAWDLTSGAYKRAGGLEGAMIRYAITGAPVYFVTGDDAGMGSDGEPVLINVRILSRAQYDEARDGYIVKEA